MGFANISRINELSIHEFGHSFVNPVIDQLPVGMIETSTNLYEPLRPSMEPQGYANWLSCVYEHFVRAGEVMIAQKMGSKADADRLLNSYIKERNFIYLPLILQELRKYDQNRNYPYLKAVESAIIRINKIAQKIKRTGNSL